MTEIRLAHGFVGEMTDVGFSGAFLIPYFFSMAICGIPLFFLEVSIGQYLGVGGMSVVGQLAPIFKGVGYSAIMMVFLENVYYIIVVTWTLFYLFQTFFDLPSLPWSSCEKGSKSQFLFLTLLTRFLKTELGQTTNAGTPTMGSRSTSQGPSLSTTSAKSTARLLLSSFGSEFI